MTFLTRRAPLALAVILLLAGAVSAQTPPMHADVWLLWSQHGEAVARADGSAPLWWRVEAGPFSADDCRAGLRKATGRPKVGMTKWYDITPQRLEALWGSPAMPDRGTWIACWPAGFDFDRDLQDK